MKSKSLPYIAAVIVLLMMSLGVVGAQSVIATQNSGAKNAATEQQWIALNWPDPGLVLSNIVYDKFPVSEVANNLKLLFSNSFDVLIAPEWSDPNRETVDPHSARISLQLRNVNATEVFRAMNLLFEAQNSPYRWQLSVNGSRPLALLRVIPELLPHTAEGSIDPLTGLPNSRAKKPEVFFVGDLIGDDTSGGLTLKGLHDLMFDLYDNTFETTQKPSLHFYVDAQLIIVTGTDEQKAFYRSTLAALRQRREFMSQKKQPASNKNRTIGGAGESKSGNEIK